MRERFDRYAVPIVAGLAVVAVAAVAIAVVALVRAGDARSRADAATTSAEALLADSVAFRLQLASLAAPLAEGLDQAKAEVEALATASFTFDVSIDQELPIDTEITFERTIDVPIKTELPVTTEFESRITINGPFGVDVPLDVTVPIDVVVPVDLVVPLAISETIPIQTVVPVKLDVPVTLDIADTELAGLALRLAAFIEALQAEAAELLGG